MNEIFSGTARFKDGCPLSNACTLRKYILFMALFDNNLIAPENF